MSQHEDNIVEDTDLSELPAVSESSSSASVVEPKSEEQRPTLNRGDSKISRIERKDFPSTISKSQSDNARAKGTPKNLRFRMISPSNSNASSSSFNDLVVVKPLGAPAPVFVRPNLQRKQSVIATVNVNGNDFPSSENYNPHVVTGQPMHVDFDSRSTQGSATTSTSSFASASPSQENYALFALPANAEMKSPDNIVVVPSKGRTHVTSWVGTERPKPGNDYFQFQFPPNKRAVGVVIPFFNEEEKELKRTLESLEIQANLVWRQKQLSMHVLLIMDGWSKASDSVREYVKFMFPAANSHLPWWTTLDDKEGKHADIETFFVQRIKPYGKKKRAVALQEVAITKETQHLKSRKLHISLIVKRDNRRKHNSHEWFFGNNGFAEFYKHEYLFATDCGTLFEEDCLYSLLSYMDRSPTTSVATGRQRVMTRGQQGSDESFLSLDTMYRMAQCYDYESSFACFMGAFALFGFLPVIPGPCGLYRAADILGKAAEWYFDVVNTDPDKSGMVLGNLRIAEDRVLSYAAVLKTKEPRGMALIPEATFYFEAECQLEKFLLQRRRWTNGTVAGYIYLILQNPTLLFNAAMNPLRKICVFFLLLCQLLVYIIVALAPGIFLTSLHATLRSVFPEPKYDQTFPDIAWYCCVALYAAMVIVHSKKKYKAWMFYLLLLVSCVIIAGAFYTYGEYIAKNGIPLSPEDTPTVGGEKSYQYISIWMVACVFIFPLLIALLHSPKSFLLMVISIIPYYLFLPTLVGWFSAYAFARTWDLTWGNRPANAEHAASSQEKKLAVERDLKTKAMTVCIFVLLFNGVFLLISEQFIENSTAVLAIGIFIFSFAGLQMVLSSIYFILYYDPRRIIQAIWRVMSFPFRKKKAYVSDQASEEEDDGVMSNADFNSGKHAITERTPSMHREGIKSTRSQTAIDIKPARSSSYHRQDKAEIVEKGPISEMKFGAVKRTPSVATAV